MAKVLTNSSSIECGDKGKVKLAAKGKLKVNGENVLVLSDINGKTVSSCQNTTDNSGNKTCMLVAAASGTASKLTVGNAAAVIDTMTGTTDGAPPPKNALSVTDAAQSKLTTV